MEQDTPDQTNNDGANLLEKGGKWLERIRGSESREEGWRDDAEAAEKTYACNPKAKAKSGKLYDFNILYSNVETIVPAIYNSTPVPDVRQRFITAIGPAPQPPAPPLPPQQPEGQGAPDQQPPPQPDPQAVQQFQQQMQAWQAKVSADKSAKDFGTMIERAITVLIDDNKLDTEIESVAQDSFLSGRGVLRLSFEATFQQQPATDEQGQPVIDPETGEPVVEDKATDESIDFQAWSWRDFRMGKAKRWKDVPWIAFQHHMPREDLDDFKDVELVASQAVPTMDNQDDDDSDICVWEVWDKRTKKVWFIDANTGAVQKIEEDPLGLPGFFPTPEIVQPITLTGNMTPVCPFTVYKKLADELDLCTKRIAAIMKGLKVRGGVMGNAADIMKIASAGDNELVSIADVEQLVQTGGLEKAVVWWPIQQAIAVLQQLYLQRDVIKSAIYEITGISDIVRGASNANETLGAQQIKTQWGSLRIQKMQRMIERQVRNVFAMMADIIVTKFSPETLQEMTGIEITPEILEMMSGPVSSSYRVDVESDSTVKAGASAQQARENIDVYSKAESVQAIGNVAAKETPIDADSVVIVDSADGNKPKKTLWSKIKALVNTASVGAAVAAANGKATPADGDFFAGVEAGGSTMFKSTWGNIKTALAAIHYNKTEVNNIVASNMSGRAYPRRQDGAALNFIGSGVIAGAPPALIGGGWEGNFNNFYFYTTTSLTVGWANGATFADSLGSAERLTAANIQNQLNWRLTDTRIVGFIQNSINIPISGGIQASVMEVNGYVHTSTWGAAGSDRNLYFGMRQPQIFIPNVGWRALGSW